MKKALYVGSFDPVTYGHLDILKRAARLVDELIVVVSASTAKRYVFSIDERLRMIEESLKSSDVTNCQVLAYDGLTVRIAKEMGVNILIRGLRSVKDFEYEKDIAELNGLQDKTIETLFLLSSARYQSISSTMVKEIAHYGGNVQELVPQQVEEKLKEAFQKVDNEE